MSQRVLVIAMLGTVLAGCQSPSASSDIDNSPWQDAKARGMVFRGVGNEPGGWVEVDAGASPTLTATLEHGERTLQVDRLQAEADGLGYAGPTSDGAAPGLTLQREACSDCMSDERHTVRASPMVDERRYPGCGRFAAE